MKPLNPVPEKKLPSTQKRTIPSYSDTHHPSLIELSLRYRVVPLFMTEELLTLGLSEQSDEQAVNAFRFATGKNITTEILDPVQLQTALTQLRAKPLLNALQKITERHSPLHQIPQDELDTAQEATAAPLVRFINHTIEVAVAQRASDIHFEPYGDSYRVRLRLDGVLQESTLSPPSHLAANIAVRLKIISGLNIAERRLPQDGRLSVILPEQLKVAMRVSTLPTRWGEKVVLRLLDGHDKPRTITQLGMPPFTQKSYSHALKQPQGLILITGPTGSGKTVTLYSGLQALNTTERNICTAEDPIEIPMEGINQLQIHPEIGLTFTQAMRAFLRQDPDIIMLGEIRDQESAMMALKAAQTGHLVLATLHTHSATTTITRLMHLGLPRYQLTSALKLIIAQRLVRCLCPHCRTAKKTDLPMQKRYQLMPATWIYEPSGCAACHGGYQGRTAIYETLLITQSIINTLLKEFNEDKVVQLGQQQGMETLQHAALQLVLQGRTSISEMHRVLGEEM